MKSLLENVSVFIAWITIPTKHKVSKTINNKFPIVFFYSLNDMWVVARQ